MRVLLIVLSGCLLWTTLAIAAHAEPRVSFQQQADSIAIEVDGKPFALYVFRDTKTLRPYVTHIRVSGGPQVTRNHPPVPEVDAMDHDTMHPGIWLAFGDLSGVDFWRNKGRVEQVSVIQHPQANGSRGSFVVRNRYLAGEREICQEVCRISIQARQGQTTLVWDSTFSGGSTSDAQAFYFGDQEEMGLGLRVATPLAVKNGGTLTNSAGGSGEKQVWGKQAEWCDYSGMIDGRPVGLLLVPDPANFGPSWFHARDYGFVAANPFGRKAFTGGDANRVLVGPGESLRLRFAVVVHADQINLEEAAERVQHSFAKHVE